MEGTYFSFRELLPLEIYFKVSANIFAENDLFKQYYYAKVRLSSIATVGTHLILRGKWQENILSLK